jgi:hypothetical protein
MEREPESNRLSLNRNAFAGFVLSTSPRETLPSVSPYGLYPYDAGSVPVSSTRSDVSPCGLWANDSYWVDDVVTVAPRRSSSAS